MRTYSSRGKADKDVASFSAKHQVLLLLVSGGGPRVNDGIVVYVCSVGHRLRGRMRRGSTLPSLVFSRRELSQGVLTW